MNTNTNNNNDTSNNAADKKSKLTNKEQYNQVVCERAHEKEFKRHQRLKRKIYYPKSYIEKINQDINNDISLLKENEAIIFTDGSFNSEKYIGGYGIVFITKNGINKYDKCFTNQTKEHREILKHHNVATECEAVIYALNKAVEYGITHATIYHDYEGIAKWANDEWATHNNYTDKYVEEMDKLRCRIDINFVKIIAHKGITFNEMADEISKNAILKSKSKFKK